MKIYELLWNSDRIDHIAQHNVTPNEVEEVCLSRQPFIQRSKSQGENPVYYVLGQTNEGRYLFCVIVRFPNGKGFPVTARNMTDKEKRRYRQWRNR